MLLSMNDLAAQLDASEHDRGEPPLGEPAHVIGNLATAGKVRSRPIIMLIVSGIALIAAIVIATAIAISNLRDSALADSERGLANTALLLAKHADRAIEELNAVQDSLIEEMQPLGNVSSENFERKMSGMDVHLMLKHKISGLSHIGSVILINSDGMLINASLEWPILATNVADWAYFKALKSDAQLTSFVSEPIRGRRTGNSTIVFARKIAAPNGEFLGVVLGTIDLQYFENFFESVMLGEGGSISLFRNDGTLLVRYPHIEPIIGHVFQGAIDALQRRTTRLVGKMDGKDRLLAAQRLEHFPLFITAGVDVAAALDNWHKEVIVLIGLGGLAALLIAAMLFIIVRQLLRGKKKFQQEFDEQKLQLNAAFSNMSQGLVMFDSAARLVVCNDRYRKIYNLPPELTKPGCTVLDLLKHRAANGTFFGNPEEYVGNLMAVIAKGKPENREIKTGDGRTILAVNQPMVGGGWVATHEDVTERKQAEALIDKNHKSLEHAETIALLGHTEFEQESGKYTWSAGVYRIMGKSPASFTPTPNSALELIHPDDQPALAQYRRDVMAGIDVPRKTLRAILDDGRIIYVEFWSVPIRAKNGTVTGKFSTIQDVTERKRIDEALARANQDLIEKQYAIDQAVIVAITDVKGKIIYGNDNFCQISGYAREELLGNNHRILNSGTHSETFFRDMYRQITNGQVWRGEICNKAKDGSQYWVDTTIVPQLGQDGKPVTYMAIRVNVTNRKRAEDELRSTQAFLDMIIENMPTPIIVKDVHEHRYTLVNRATEECFGIPRDKMIGRNVHELFPKEEADSVVMHDSEALQSDRPLITDTYPLHTPHNGTRLLTAKRLAIRDNGGNPQHILTVLEDVTERSRSEQRIAHMAHHDTLTDLPNRAAFNERLASALDQAAIAHEQFAIMSIDFDRFKEINDLFGHAVGDALLLEVACRMQVTAGEAFLARLGGDEFSLIVADGPQPATASTLADRLLAAVAGDIKIEGLQLRMGLSIGVAVYPASGTDAKSLMNNADAALYRAKAEARGSVRFFEPEMDTRLRERLALQNDLRLAIDHGELTLHYQPQLKMAGEPVGFEALVRWQCPKRGMVAPGTFIPIAEESSLIISVGEWVLRKACREAASWPQPLTIAVNVSPVQFHNGDLPSLVHSILLETGLAPARLELEITEGVLINDFSHAVSILRRLKALGVQIALDDFGTGYSSLSYLHSFAFDKIKIDRAFIGDLEHNRHSMAIVRAVISLGRSLDLPVLAEGVESNAQHAFLLQEGCDEVQGYLTGRPLPIADYAELVGRQAISQQRYSTVG